MTGARRRSKRACISNSRPISRGSETEYNKYDRQDRGEDHSKHSSCLSSSQSTSSLLSPRGTMRGQTQNHNQPPPPPYSPSSYSYSSSEDSEHIRRATSSPHLNSNEENSTGTGSNTSNGNGSVLRMRMRTRVRSGSASSSSASLTATEDNYNNSYNHVRGSQNHNQSHNQNQVQNQNQSQTPYFGPGYGYGYGFGQGMMSSASASAFPYPVPPLWTFASPPLHTGNTVSQRGSILGGVPNGGGRSRSSVLVDDRDRADTSSSDEYEAEGREEDEMMFMSRASSSTTISLDGGSSGLGSSTVRQRRKSGSRRKDKDGELVMTSLPHPRIVATGRGQLCAGETETEADEIPIRLPTSRNVTSGSVILLPVDLLVNFLFQVTRFLSIIPATFGTIFNIHHALYPPPSSGHISYPSIDFTVCALWAILTGIQCLALTTGLLSRWKAYYATPSVLIRLVGLQAICWPATHFTLRFFEHELRPVMCWVLIGTTTCISRSVQLWVTSNLYYAPEDRAVGAGAGSSGNVSANVKSNAGGGTGGSGDRATSGSGSGTVNSMRANRRKNLNNVVTLAISGAFGAIVRAAIGGDSDDTTCSGTGVGGGKVRRAEGKLGPRRWDWAEVMVKCAVPAGILYFITVWGMFLKNELVMRQVGGGSVDIGGGIGGGTGDLGCIYS